MKQFKCPECGSDILLITFDATVTHRVILNEEIKDDPFEYDTGVYDTDYNYLYAYCGECHQEIYEGRYSEHLKETIINEGWYTET